MVSFRKVIQKNDEGKEVKKLSSKETSVFCEQVALVLQAGIPLYDSMETLCDAFRDTPYSSRFETLEAQVKEHGSLYLAVEAAGFFPEYMVKMIQIGERAGHLDIVMAELAAYYARDDRIRSATRSAIRYPLVLVGMMSVVIVVLMTSVLPIFNQVFRNLGLGESSNWMMRLSMSFGRNALIVVAVLVLGAAILALLLRTRHREAITKFFMKVFPPIRNLLRKMSAGRFASVMAMMLASGFPLDEAIELAPGVLTDEAMKEKLKICREKLQEGVSFAEAVEQLEFFDLLSNKMVHAGSLTGQMDQVMRKLAARYDDEVDDALRSLVGAIEPALVGLLTTVVGAILLSIMLPLAGMISSMT